MKSLQRFRDKKDEFFRLIRDKVSASEFDELYNEINLFYNMLNYDSLNYFYYDKVYERVNITILKTVINVFHRIFNIYTGTNNITLIRILDSMLNLYITFFNELRFEISSVCSNITYLNKSSEDYAKILTIYMLPLFSKQ